MKKIKLYSLNKSLYPDIEVEVEEILETEKEIERISEGKPFPAIKKAIVQARPAKIGEIIDTRPRVEVDGKIYTMSETQRTITEEDVKNGAVVVVNPDGEEYVIASYSKFKAKYEKVENGYIAIDGAKLFVRSNGNYAIQTSWGEEQIVLLGSYFCVEDRSDIYGVTNSAFEGTYAKEPEQIRLISHKMQLIKDQRDSGKQ